MIDPKKVCDRGILECADWRLQIHRIAPVRALD